ncbi:MAG: hypothetical protein QNJ40_16645 [Xanthomonadales bacterium]|nr:hypothetical protein [Xanthomonadales bacterium]
MKIRFFPVVMSFAVLTQLAVAQAPPPPTGVEGPTHKGIAAGYPTVKQQTNSTSGIADRIQVVPDDVTSAPAHLKAEALDSSLQMKNAGFIATDEREVEVIDFALKNSHMFKSMGHAVENLASPMVNLQGTWLDDAELIGVSLEGGFINGKRTASTRFFDAGPMGYLLFSESDLVLQGGRTIIGESSVNFEVNEMPGIHIVMMAPSGKSQSEFTWFGGDKMFQIVVGQAVPKGSKSYKKIRKLAKQVSKARVR